MEYTVGVFIPNATPVPTMVTTDTVTSPPAATRRVAAWPASIAVRQ
jgi:hypothetical protein